MGSACRQRAPTHALLTTAILLDEAARWRACGTCRRRPLGDPPSAAAAEAPDRRFHPSGFQVVAREQRGRPQRRPAMAAGGGTTEADQPAAAGLLQLPDLLLHVIFSHLTSATDLAAVAASCSALRALVRGSSWDQPSTLAADIFTPALPATLVWAAERLPRVSAPRSALLQVGVSAGCPAAGLWLDDQPSAPSPSTHPCPACSCTQWTSLGQLPAAMPTCCRSPSSAS